MTDKVEIQVVFDSMYGHVHRMAEAIAEGTRSVAGTEVDIFQVRSMFRRTCLSSLERSSHGRTSHRYRQPQLTTSRTRSSSAHLRGSSI